MLVKLTSGNKNCERVSSHNSREFEKTSLKLNISFLARSCKVCYFKKAFEYNFFIHFVVHCEKFSRVSMRQVVVKPKSFLVAGYMFGSKYSKYKVQRKIFKVQRKIFNGEITEIIFLAS
jgi:hypothetical protein